MRRALVALGLLAAAACSRGAPDATPEGAVRVWLDKMEATADDPRALREAYGLLGPATRANLEERARRATQAQGRRFEPFEMLADGRFGLRFRPKSMRASVVGDRASVEVVGDNTEVEKASVRCVREAGGWRIEPELPELVVQSRRDGGV